MYEGLIICYILIKMFEFPKRNIGVQNFHNPLDFLGSTLDCTINSLTFSQLSKVCLSYSIV